MRLVKRCPAINEETDGDEASTRYHQRDAELRTADVVIAHLEFAVDTTIDWGTDLCSKEEADIEGNIVQPKQMKAIKDNNSRDNTAYAPTWDFV